MPEERLQKILSQAGVTSRRKAEELIVEGRVSVNGKTVTELGSKADIDNDHIKVDGRLLRAPKHLTYIALNKPKECMTTVSDPEGRQTVMHLMRGVHERVFPVGRLDYHSEGLLLLTNDGEFAHRLTAPANHVTKTYVVKVNGALTEAQEKQFREGIPMHGRKTAPAELKRIKHGPNPWYEVKITEGRQNQIRIMFKHFGKLVEKLRRVKIGFLELDVAPARYRSLTHQEVEKFRRVLKLDKETNELPSASRGSRTPRKGSDAYNNIGVILRAQEKLPAAAACFRRSLTLRPDNASVLSNLGNVLWQMLRFEEAATAFRRSIELEPNRAETLHNLGLLLHSMGDLPAAIDCFDKSLVAKKDNVDVLWDRSLTRLVKGDFDPGWPEYEVRWRLKHNPPRKYAFPLWEGQEGRNLSLLVHHEQGLGDTLQFCRYLPMVAPRVGRLVLECQLELARLMTCLPGVAEVVPSGRQAPTCDYHVPLLNLPKYFKTNFDNIPAEIPYLQTPAGVSAPTVHRPAGTKLAVGIVWAGKPSHNNDKNRSTSLDRFLCLADLPGVTLYSLQKGLRTADIQTIGAQALVQDLGSKLTDFAETSALLPQLDLIVAVDTAVIHLAGALGVPAFVLIPFTPDWRWLRGRDDTPWYPTVRLFRQPKPRDWDSVFDRIRAAVQALL